MIRVRIEWPPLTLPFALSHLERPRRLSVRDLRLAFVGEENPQ